jgi:hypothetical protein
MSDDDTDTDGTSEWSLHELLDRASVVQSMFEQDVLQHASTHGRFSFAISGFWESQEDFVAALNAIAEGLVAIKALVDTGEIDAAEAWRRIEACLSTEPSDG